MTIKAVIFDFGGVLMRTGDPVGRREWENRLGLLPGTLEHVIHQSAIWHRAQCGLVGVDDYWREVALALHLPLADLPALRMAYFRDDRLDLDLMALVDALRSAGYKVGLLSNEALSLEDKLRRDLAIYDRFDGVVISAAIGVMKPDAGAYQAIARLLDLHPTECVFIDDVAANVAGARQAGMKAIQYQPDMDVRAALAPLLDGQD